MLTSTPCITCFFQALPGSGTGVSCPRSRCLCQPRVCAIGPLRGAAGGQIWVPVTPTIRMLPASPLATPTGHEWDASHEAARKGVPLHSSHGNSSLSQPAAGLEWSLTSGPQRWSVSLAPCYGWGNRGTECRSHRESVTAGHRPQSWLSGLHHRLSGPVPSWSWKENPGVLTPRPQF